VISAWLLLASSIPGVLKSTLQSLLRECPRHLLAKELLLGTSSASGWWQRQQMYALSSATSSIVGYLLGLGDRHLDNLLLDKACGQIVHIDYSVCFDKGLGLRVPEVVPFRLTAMMQVRQ
jgi:PI-3-kinase-related kinase SMG-1